MECISAATFRNPAIPMRLVDVCASRHLRPSLFQRVRLGSMSVAGKRIRSGPLYANSAAGMAPLVDDERPKGERNLPLETKI